MRVHLPRLYLGGQEDLPVARVERLAALDRLGAHEITSDADAADIHLFTQCHMLPTDWALTSIRNHPLTEGHRETVFVYNEGDRPWCVLPGIYVSMPDPTFDPRYQRAWAYYANPKLSVHAQPPLDSEPDLLFSFIGKTSSARCRRPLRSLLHPHALVEDVSDFSPYDASAPDFKARRDRYSDILRRSRFVLCPRGRGTSSYRLYETLKARRVPVIIADDWVPPKGPDWSAFSMRWPEGNIAGLVEAIEDHDARWSSMSAAAAAAYDEFFAADVAFHRIVEHCKDLLETADLARFPRTGVRNRAYFAAAADVARWTAMTAIRRRTRRALTAFGLPRSSRP